MLKDIYRVPLSLFTDLYQITMAYSFWKSKKHEQKAVFNLFFRNSPFHGGYAVACGIEPALEYIENFKFTAEEIQYLKGLVGVDQAPLFSQDFLTYLEKLKLSVQVDGIEEGRVVFPHEPILRIQGSILQCQLLETALLNLINFQTLIATKAARVKSIAGSDPVFEFGARRAQGVDGALSASRAAYLGGCDGTSNLLAGRLYQIPVKGTHAHSWVMAFDDELEAFYEFARAMPNNSIFLVDTYQTIEGVKKAIEAGKWLRAQGHQMLGIRLDSGDLAVLSIEARRLLDQAGFENCVIVGSNDLDETLIANLKQQGAQINVWGVGTKLVTADPQPALGGVYKLVALENASGAWEGKIKISEQAIKTTIPGVQQIRRFRNAQHLLADVIFDEENPPQTETLVMIDPLDVTRRRKISTSTSFEDLLIPMIRNGKRVDSPKPLSEIRERGIRERELLQPATQRFLNPNPYAVGLEESLYERRAQMILARRGF